ncbi:biotin transporter BioY [Pseudochrobactrum sp. HB0163]|uniref:biotin transporter BioY n=1 Tax=Pseudochrobactrum sp. HB0163 TaxID=3450708 RepID=UPI003F6E050D
MSLAHAVRQPAFSPLNLAERSAAMKLLAVISGTMILALTSQITVPMLPVPITLQTLIVPLIGALYGWRFGMLTVLAWLGEAAMGMPVLAGGNGTLAAFSGPTAGYLFAFPVIAALTGLLAERGWNGSSLPKAFVAFLIANILALVLGAAWLSLTIGAEKAILVGVMPFLIGGLIKSALGAAILKASFRKDA